jgi:prepilin-type N-terminal cleavage/methylation domain-containing protein
MIHKHFSRPRGRGGFTLVELMAVCVIVAVMAAMGGPRLITWIRTITTRGAVDQLASDLSVARVQAVRNGQTVSLRFMADTLYRVTVDDVNGTAVRTIKTVAVSSLHRGVRISPSGARVAFDSRGLLRPNPATTHQRLEVLHGGRTRAIEISDIGRVRRVY